MYRSDQVIRRFSDLQDFAAMLERRGRLRRISRPVSLVHEVTEIHRRVLLADGPALLFEKPVDASGRICDIPLLANLFGTIERQEVLSAGVGIPYLSLLLMTTRLLLRRT